MPKDKDKETKQPIVINLKKEDEEVQVGNTISINLYAQEVTIASTTHKLEEIEKITNRIIKKQFRDIKKRRNILVG